MSEKYKIFIYFFVLALILSSIYFGYDYSVYNQDYHHTFFIFSSKSRFENANRLVL